MTDVTLYIALAASLAVLRAQTTGPFAPQGPKLLGTGVLTTVNGGASQGRSVALSADGNTAVVGGDSDDGGRGAAWVFTRSNGVWSQQQELTTSDVVSAFGISVGLSADGNTAVVGCNCQAEAVWLFTRNNGVWGPAHKLLPAGMDLSFKSQVGYSVAISSEGNTVLIGAPAADNGVGAAVVFVNANGVWTQQGAELVGAGALGLPQQGFSVALSANGNTAVVGGPFDKDPNAGGATWIFSRINGVWDQGTKLVGSTSTVSGGRQGESVAISGDGNTVVAGGPYSASAGAWVFVRANGAWSQQAGLLAGPNADKFSGEGMSVALNADGNVAIVGGPGANDAWLFTRAGGTWTLRQELVRPEVTTTGFPPQLGYSAAISADTTTVLLGSPQDDPQGARSTGAAWAFYAPPASIAATAGTPQFVLLGAAFPTRLQATVLDTLGYPAPGVTVAFTAPASGLGGTFPGGATLATVVTDAAGIATAPAFTANQFAGSYTVSATVSGLTAEADFALANQTAIVQPVISGIVSAATDAPPAANSGLTQGSFVSIYGSNLGPVAGTAATALPLVANLGGATVTFTPANGSPQTAYEVYVGAGQINAILPSTLPVGPATVTVTYNGATSAPAPIQVVASAFGIFTANYGSGPAAAIDMSTPAPIITTTNAAHPGDYISLFGTGLGPVNAPDNQAPGGVSPAGISVQVVVGGQIIAPLYAGRAPQFPAEDQINFQLPAGVALGCGVPVVVVVNGAQSNSATLAIASSGSACS